MAEAIVMPKRAMRAPRRVAKPAPTGPATLTTAEQCRCRWPLWADAAQPAVGDEIICGAPFDPASRMPYCPVHRRVAIAERSEPPQQHVEGRG